MFRGKKAIDGPGQPGAQSCDGSTEHSSLLGGTSCGRSVLLCMFIPPWETSSTQDYKSGWWWKVCAMHKEPSGRSTAICKPFCWKWLALWQKEKKEILREDRNGPGHCEAVWDSWLLIAAAKHLSPTHNPVRPLDSSVSRRLRKTSVRSMFPNPHKIVFLQRTWHSMD